MVHSRAAPPRSTRPSRPPISKVLPISRPSLSPSVFFFFFFLGYDREGEREREREREREGERTREMQTTECALIEGRTQIQKFSSMSILHAELATLELFCRQSQQDAPIYFLLLKFRLVLLELY